MGQMAPPPPEGWAELREQNRKASRHAAPAEQPAAARELESHEYEVVGHRNVFGHEPGSVVELALTEGEERALLESGHLARHVEEDTPAELPVEEVAVAAETASVVAHQEDDLK